MLPEQFSKKRNLRSTKLNTIPKKKIENQEDAERFTDCNSDEEPLNFLIESKGIPHERSDFEN